MKKHDVVIIGGGVAGLVARRELSQRGLKVLLLEAKNRLGGRGWTSDFEGEKIEFGGGYIHWSQPHVWAEVNRYDLKIKERPNRASGFDMAKTRWLRNGQIDTGFNQETAKAVEQAYLDFVAPAKTVFPRPFDPFFNDFYKQYDGFSAKDRIDALNLNEIERDALLRTTAIQANNDPSVGGYLEALRWFALSFFNMEIYGDSMSRYLFENGTDDLINAFKNDGFGEILLENAVEKVIQTKQSVQVLTKNQTFKSKAVVVATPLNTWKDIHFTPSVSNEKWAFSEEEHSGKGLKIYIKVKGAFPYNRCSATLDESIISILPQRIGENDSTIIAFTNPMHPITPLSIEGIERQLKRFDSEIEVIDFKLHDWNNDPFIRGTWCNFKPNQFSRYFKQAQSPEGKVFFAGADIANGWRGFFDGAIESGVRVAHELMKSLMQTPPQY